MRFEVRQHVLNLHPPQTWCRGSEKTEEQGGRTRSEGRGRGRRVRGEPGGGRAGERGSKEGRRNKN